MLRRHELRPQSHGRGPFEVPYESAALDQFHQHLQYLVAAIGGRHSLDVDLQSGQCRVHRHLQW